MESGIGLPAITRPVAGIAILTERRKDNFIVVQLATPNLLNDPIQCSTMPSKVVTLKWAIVAAGPLVDREMFS
jgi:hypothetical protein